MRLHAPPLPSAGGSTIRRLVKAAVQIARHDRAGPGGTTALRRLDHRPTNGNCKTGGNILDFVALMEFENKEPESVRKAALLLKEWFMSDPAAGEAVFDARSPINHADRISSPVIFFQGLEDKVVPPNQAETMVAALKSRGIDVRYLTFPNEGHGFRRADTLVSCLESQLEFFLATFKDSGHT